MRFKLLHLASCFPHVSHLRVGGTDPRGTHAPCVRAILCDTQSQHHTQQLQQPHRSRVALAAALYIPMHASKNSLYVTRSRVLSQRSQYRTCPITCVAHINANPAPTSAKDGAKPYRKSPAGGGLTPDPSGGLHFSLVNNLNYREPLSILVRLCTCGAL
jgi:hypothetical protein